MSNFFKKAYDSITDSSSKVGRIGKHLYPFNGQYFVRDGWRSLKKRLAVPTQTGTTGSVNSAGSLYGINGSIVGRF